MFKIYPTSDHVPDCYTSYYHDNFVQGTGPFQYHHFSHPLHIIVTPLPDGSLLTNKVKVAVSLNNQAMMIRVSVFFTCVAD
jgi:hypothetical protein